jgi:hypothetical protein
MVILLILSTGILWPSVTGKYQPLSKNILINSVNTKTATQIFRLKETNHKCSLSSIEGQFRCNKKASISYRHEGLYYLDGAEG